MIPRNVAFLVVLLLAPLVGQAQVMVSEIMYDLPGSDSGREWIEVENKGSLAVDLTKIKLLEAGVKHGVNPVSGQSALAPGSFAIIAENSEKFLVDNPTFSGTLFNSSFSLSNTGEMIALVDASSTIDSVLYQSSQGGAGTGFSLQKKDGAFLAAKPSPGRELLASDVPTPPPPPAMVKVVSKSAAGAEESNTTARNSTESEVVTSGAAPSSENAIYTASRNVPPSSSSLMWWVALGGVLTLGAGAAYLAKPRRQKISSVADEYEIVE